MILIIEQSTGVPLVLTVTETAREAIPARTEMRPVPQPAPVEGEPPMPPTLETVEVAAAVPAETEAYFRARMLAAHVPAGSRYIVDPVLPPVAPELWSVDWTTGAVTVNDAATLAAAKAQAHADIDAFARGIRMAFSETNDPVRLAARVEKAGIARRMLAGETVPANEVAALAAEALARGRGETTAELAVRVNYWANADMLAACIMEATQSAATKAINDCLTADAVLATLDGVKAQVATVVAQMKASRTGPPA